MVSLKRTIVGIPIVVETHDKPHLDEIAALWMLENFATKQWVEQHCANGTLQLGVGGGPFDEHPQNGTVGTREDCCATLVATSLGPENPALTQILKFIFNVDVKGAGHPFDLYNLVKYLNEVCPKDPEHVIAWAYEALGAKYAEQADFVASREAVRRAASTLSLNADTSLLLVVVESDCKSIAKAASEIYGSRYAACIVRRSTGHVQVFTNKRADVRLYEAVRLLRLVELRRIAESRGRREVTKLTDSELRCPGFAPGVPEWYYHVNGELILNGSLTATDVPPTRLPTELIADCVLLGIQRTMQESRTVTSIPALRI